MNKELIERLEKYVELLEKLGKKECAEVIKNDIAELRGGKNEKCSENRRVNQ